jgi:Mrp family chromosome partitioning ATPase
MNKHAELMLQQLENDQLFDSEPSRAALLPFQEEKHKSNGQKRWVGDETLQLVQQLFFHQREEPPRVVVFAGVEHGNGCSQICASVAEILAKTARGPVSLVEANFRSPALPGLFGKANHRGLTDALLQGGPISSFVQLAGEGNLWLLPSGPLTSDSPSLLGSEEFRERLEELRQTCDFVIIDAPPLTQYSDAIALSRLSDGIVLVLEADSTRLQAASAVTANLRSMKVPILAAVLNKHTFPIPEKIMCRL